MKRCVVIGAGIGGLTVAAILARRGFDVTVLEAQTYPGGCANTFYHQGYRFDAGATLAGGFNPGGPMEMVAEAAGIENWPVIKAEPSMRVHLPNGKHIDRWGGERRWQERLIKFGSQGENFWRWQERTADAMWDLALRLPTWPPQNIADLVNLVQNSISWLREDPQHRLRINFLQDALQPLKRHLRGASEDLRTFVDAQLLISAQTTSEYANALFGAAALDLPRRGVVHLQGGMGGIAQTLVKALQQNGGKIYYRQEATQIEANKHRLIAVKTKRGDSFTADVLVFNLPIWNTLKLLKDGIPMGLNQQIESPPNNWGAFTVYLGVDEEIIPENLPLHHQIIRAYPFGEGNSVFLSISPPWDNHRAPKGKRAITMSTHTSLGSWWELHQHDIKGYQARKEAYLEKMLVAGDRILASLRESASLVLPGTPITFQRFTGRIGGWVGGYAQTNLFKFRGPRIGPDLWMVGDSIFPGQSTAAVALGGVRVAEMIFAAQHAGSHQLQIQPEINFPTKVGIKQTRMRRER